MRTVVDLDSAVLDGAPEHLGECLLPFVAPVELAVPDGAGTARERKRDWVAGTTAEWGTCGQAVLVEGRVAGAVVYAPPSYLPGLAGLPTTPLSPDAVAMASVLVAVGYDERGVGRLLVQAMARDLLTRYGSAGVVRAVEAICGGEDACAPQLAVCEAAGFRERRAHPTYPRVRLDLRGTVSWRGELEQALERLRAGVRAPARAPAGPATHRGSTEPRDPRVTGAP
jgi:hypothetical protein